MGMGTPAESSPTEAHLNDLATRTILEDSGGFISVMAPQGQPQSLTAVLTLAFGGQWSKCQTLRRSQSPRG